MDGIPLYECMKYALLVILFVFICGGVYNSPDIKHSDRDEAVIMSFNSEVTHLGNPITTGINKYLAYPFIRLTGDYKDLTFIFWLVIILWAFINMSDLFLFSVVFIMTGVVARTMYYRLDEIYFCLLSLFLFKSWIMFFVWGFLSRNWSKLNGMPMPHFAPSLILDYVLFIPLTILYATNPKGK